MQTVYVLQHLHVLPDDVEDVKLIGVYSSRASALEAIQRKRGMPGFQDFPQLVDTTAEAADPNGFYIGEYQLDIDYWSEGFITV